MKPIASIVTVATVVSASYLSTGSNPLLSVSQPEWTQFNQSISGRLYNASPLALACYDVYQNSTGAYTHQSNAEECKLAHDKLTHSEQLIQDFGSYHNPSFSSCMATGQKCLISPANGSSLVDGTCYQGTVPEYYVEATNVQDIQTALKFSRKHKLPVTVKNTGHDYRGRSTGPDTIAIWTHKIQPDMKLEQQYTPDGCDEDVGPVVTYGAGQTFGKLYDFIHQQGYMMVGGSCPTVGAAGGWLSGGGYGTLTPKHGLGVDNAMQIKVVLPDGRFVTANRCKNRDIFFALRGGGGGTFGVVTETTSRIIKDDKPLTMAILAMNVPKDVRNISEIFVANSVDWMNQGWSGSLGVRENNSASFIAINFDKNTTAAEQSLKPIIDFFQSVSSDSVNFTKAITTLPNYYSFQTSTINQGFVARGIGYMAVQASRLIPKRIFESTQSQKDLVDALVQQPYGGMLVAPQNFNLALSDRKGGPGEASVTPAWRNSIWHLVYQDIFDGADPALNSPSALAARFKKVSKNMDRVRALAPDSGAYQNEGDTYEPDYGTSFWGKANFKRLLKIKKTLDPDNLLSCFRCLGWDASNARHHCYPDIQ